MRNVEDNIAVGRHGTKDVNSALTICELHRRLYDILVVEFRDNPEALKETTLLINECFHAGLSLVAKLVEYKIELPEWPEDKISEEQKQLRSIRNQIIQNKLKTIHEYWKEKKEHEKDIP